jgi:hypothetical protein
MVALSFGLGYLYWDSALAAVRAWLDARCCFRPCGAGWPAGRRRVAPGAGAAACWCCAAPVLDRAALLLVALLMAPAVLRLVATAALLRRWSGAVPARCWARPLWSLGSHRAGAGGAGAVAAAVAGAAADPGRAAADLGLAHLPRDELRRAGRPRQRAERREILRRHRTPLLAWASSAATWGRRPAWCGPRWRCSPSPSRCWSRWRSGSTRWCSPSRRCGSPTTAWRRCKRCASSAPAVLSKSKRSCPRRTRRRRMPSRPVP